MRRRSCAKQPVYGGDTSEGWTIEQAPVLFARYSHQLPQVEPVHNAPTDILDKLLDQTNIAREDHRLLQKVYLVALFIPEISKAVHLTHGAQGSGKTFLQKLVKSVVDPSAADTLAIPRNPAELLQQLHHNYVALYDNLSRLDDWASDIFCKAVTGGGSSKRMLYSDDDDIVFNFKRCIMLNGINVAARKGDLLDRSIMVELQRIPKDRRKKESELLAELERIKPQVLGYIMDVLVQVLKRKGEVKLSEYPRLADFAEYGELIARCMGVPNNQFIGAYFDNQRLQTIEALEAQPVAAAIMRLIETDEEWGPKSLGDLLDALEGIAVLLKINTSKNKGWPKAPNSLSRRLNEVKTNLREVGILVEMERDAKNRQSVSIRKISPEPPVSPEAKNPAQTTLSTPGDITGAISGSISGQN